MTEPPQSYSLLLLGALMVLSGFFSGTEAALFSLSRMQLRRMEESGLASGRSLRRLLREPRRILITILAGNETSNVAISAIAGGIGIALGVPWWATVVVTVLFLMTFCEILPKTIARQWPEGFSRVVQRPLALFIVVLTPIRWVLQLFVGWLEPKEGEEEPEGGRPLGEDEFLMLVGLGLREGVLKDREGRLIESVFEMEDVKASQIMTPRTEVFAIEAGTTLDTALELLRDRHHSRVPVYGEDLDDIRGILYTVDVLRAVVGGRSRERVEKVCTAPLFVPEQKKAVELFRTMRRRKVHLAVVVDEYGGVSGVVTLDDILLEMFEELPGGRDENGEEELRQVGDGVYVVAGWLEVERFNEITGGGVGDRGNETVGGAVFSRLGHLPKEGEIISLDGHSFKVLRMDGHRVASLRVTIKREES